MGFSKLKYDQNLSRDGRDASQNVWPSLYRERKLPCICSVHDLGNEQAEMLARRFSLYLRHAWTDFVHFFVFLNPSMHFKKFYFMIVFVLTSTKSFMSSSMWEKGKRCAGRDIYQETQQIQKALLQYVNLYISNKYSEYFQNLLTLGIRDLCLKCRSGCNPYF
jgi:hypothetical protein